MAPSIFEAAQPLPPRLENGELVLSWLVCTKSSLLYLLQEYALFFSYTYGRYIGVCSGYEAFERMAFYGIASNLVNYLTTQLHEDTVSSVRNVNNWSGSVWMTPIIGAYVADAYLGRFWTFTLSSLIYVMVNHPLSTFLIHPVISLL